MSYLSVRECYSQGYDHGWSLATWTPLPELGTIVPRDIDWTGVETVDSVEAQLEAWEMMLDAADENSRQYSPFEFIAHDINARDEHLGEGEAESGWDAFERGMTKAFSDYRKKTYPIRFLRKDYKEWQKKCEEE